jgi:hypothetical protein
MPLEAAQLVSGASTLPWEGTNRRGQNGVIHLPEQATVLNPDHRRVVGAARHR